MKVTCVGTDPAGLYLGILLKRRNSSHVVRFVESPDAGLGSAAIIGNPLKPRLKLDDAETFRELEQTIASFDRVAVDVDGRSLQTKGLKYATVDRAALTDIL